eukprot:TRINITY_DN20712_c0_g1_i1.p1 TRINITY_DN20712_c0_g1~~TRINITY_DN20712_c0_g1_i1.p1  ORF type:complete len:120 (+),score=7.19 TRINITY_DN20712_c0_g1_i1:292-651(+)
MSTTRISFFHVQIRPLWKHYLAACSGLVFVVDLADVDRLTTAREELWSLLSQEELKGVPLLLYGNKKDLAGAITAEKLRTDLGVAGIKDRKWKLVTCSAIKGPVDLVPGMIWLYKNLKH